MIAEIYYPEYRDSDASTHVLNTITYREGQQVYNLTIHTYFIGG
jgi:hypothetical protein